MRNFDTGYGTICNGINREALPSLCFNVNAGMKMIGPEFSKSSSQYDGDVNWGLKNIFGIFFLTPNDIGKQHKNPQKTNAHAMWYKFDTNVTNVFFV